MTSPSGVDCPTQRGHTAGLFSTQLLDRGLRGGVPALATHSQAAARPVGSVMVPSAVKRRPDATRARASIHVPRYGDLRSEDAPWIPALGHTSLTGEGYSAD